jgi:hypothetical protein
MVGADKVRVKNENATSAFHARFLCVLWARARVRLPFPTWVLVAGQRDAGGSSRGFQILFIWFDALVASPKVLAKHGYRNRAQFENGGDLLFAELARSAPFAAVQTVALIFVFNAIFFFAVRCSADAKNGSRFNLVWHARRAFLRALIIAGACRWRQLFADPIARKEIKKEPRSPLGFNLFFLCSARASISLTKAKRVIVARLGFRWRNFCGCNQRCFRGCSSLGGRHAFKAFAVVIVALQEALDPVPASGNHVGEGRLFLPANLTFRASFAIVQEIALVDIFQAILCSGLLGQKRNVVALPRQARFVLAALGIGLAGLRREWPADPIGQDVQIEDSACTFRFDLLLIIFAGARVALPNAVLKGVAIPGICVLICGTCCWLLRGGLPVRPARNARSCEVEKHASPPTHLARESSLAIAIFPARTSTGRRRRRSRRGCCFDEPFGSFLGCCFPWRGCRSNEPFSRFHGGCLLRLGCFVRNALVGTYTQKTSSNLLARRPGGALALAFERTVVTK